MNPIIDFINGMVEIVEQLSENLQILQQQMIIDEEEKRIEKRSLKK
ncbi:MAG: hypothetical protein IKZ29_02790 [Clostridiales bacterium]|nr:hypothetical protein [Clostridiales bacterium]